MSRVTWSLNGFELDRESFRVTVGTSFFPSIKTKRNVIAVAGRSGSIATGGLPVFEEREVTIQTVAWGDEWKSKADAFHRVCSMPVLTLVRREYAHGRTQVMQTRVELESLAANGDVRPVNERVEETAVFALPDVWWQGVSELEASLPLTGGVLSDGAETLPEWFSNAPIANMVVRIPLASQVMVTDPVSGTGLSWNGTKATGARFVYLDSSSMRAWTSSSDAEWTGGTDASTGLDYPAAGPLMVWPSADGSYSLMMTTDIPKANSDAGFVTWWTGAENASTSQLFTTDDGLDAVIRFRQAWW
jgi:hypothetical protein